jgi:hypothetical protein
MACASTAARLGPPRSPSRPRSSTACSTLDARIPSASHDQQWGMRASLPLLPPWNTLPCAPPAAVSLLRSGVPGQELPFIVLLCPSASRRRCRAIRSNGLKISFPQVSSRLVTGPCENDLDLAGECRRLTSVADCDAVDRQRLLCSARHCACSKSGRSAKDTTGAGVDPTSESGDLPVLRAAPAVLNGKPLAALAART